MIEDRLSAALIEGALATQRLGHPTLYYPTIGSTNDEAHAQAAAGAPHGLLVVADEQTAGRGRLDRRWWAPPGSSLLLSLLLRPPLPAAAAGQLPMCLGLGAVEGIEAATGLRPALKWPNDLLLDGRKLAGMLPELRLEGERIEHAVLGVGINVNMTFSTGREVQPGEDAPPDVAAIATSLSRALGRPVARLPLLAAILARTERWYERLMAGQSPYDAWSARLATLGQRVTVTLPAGQLAGVAIGVNAGGALLVRLDGGEVETVWAGDVVAVRGA